jgi:hypothetical protein
MAVGVGAGRTIQFMPSVDSKELDTSRAMKRPPPKAIEKMSSLTPDRSLCHVHAFEDEAIAPSAPASTNTPFPKAPHNHWPFEGEGTADQFVPSIETIMQPLAPATTDIPASAHTASSVLVIGVP